MNLVPLDLMAKAAEASERSTRGGFLARAGAASLAAVTGVVAAGATPAHAWGEDHECGLCADPNGPCGPVVCWWCWWGDPHRNGPCPEACHVTQCCEGYTASGNHCHGQCFTYYFSCSRYGANKPAVGCGPC